MGRPPIGKRAMTGAERVRRHREARRQAHVTKQEPLVTKPAKTRSQMVAAGRDAPRDHLKADRSQILQSEIGRLRGLLAKAEARLESVPAAERDRLVERLKTENRNLKAERRTLNRHFEEQARKLERAWAMPRSTYIRVVAALHEDKKSVAASDIREALGLFTEWWKKANKGSR